MISATFATRWSLLAGRASQTARAFVGGLRTHAILYAAAGFTQFVAIAASYYLGRASDLRMVLLFSLPIFLIMGAAAFFLMIKELGRLWLINHEGSAILALGRFVINDLLAPQRVANVVHAGIAMSIFMSAFTTLKAFLPDLHPFQWDTTLMVWDRYLHFGYHPYEILHPLLGWPYVTVALNLAYNAWFFVMFAAWVWQGFTKHETALRQRFLLAFMITWFLGTNVLGTIFSSVGPCFYHRLSGQDDPFQPLTAYLNQVHMITAELYAIRTQNMLWDAYVTGEGAIKGISAMPSMHVATCVLLALLGFASGRRWLGWCFVVFGMIIFSASVHLAWHYAIDGYAGVAGALFGWFAAGRLVRWDRARQSLVYGKNY